ncbi:MAG TPA: preprotein translocase subunit YajC [Verrucomicrobiae bacterium]|nr:preprotein translocase subunit YajC [Verrucomicrobiae bacterium]
MIASFGMGMPPANGQQQNPTAQMLQMLGTMGFFIVVMYVVMIRPQQKKAKEHELLLKNVKKGDKVVTSSGIIGVVLSVSDRTVSIRSADTKLEILKSAVTEISGDAPEAQA